MYRQSMVLARIRTNIIFSAKNYHIHGRLNRCILHMHVCLMGFMTQYACNILTGCEDAYTS